MDDQQLYAMRHSLAHIMAQAVQRLWPEAKFGVGPVVENGFYYDIDLGETKISEDDFPRIEAEMRKIVEENYPFEQSEMPIDEAIEWATTSNQPYKLELLNDLKRAGTTVASELDSAELGLAADGKGVVEKVSFYTDGDFTDLCRGPHATTTGSVGVFKLMRVAGAYWRGKSDNAQMQRLYGVAFQEQSELDKHLEHLEEAKKRDHRKLGQDLELFYIDELSGKGLITWLPNGTIVRDEIEALVREKEAEYDYQRIVTPNIAKEELFLKSGHLPYYKEDMYPGMVMDDGTYYLKAMNCPHHHRVFQYKRRSYREMPLRFAEYGTVYRNELSGTLAGLLRVRGMAMNDAHIYCTKDQIKAEFKAVLDLTKEYFAIFRLEDYWFRLSKWSPNHTNKYINEPENWEFTQDVIREVLVEENMTFREVDDEAAFYGPKVDVQFTSVVGREETMSTIQLDFAAKTRFGLSYIDAGGEENNDVFVIHRAPLSVHERFMAFLIEHYAGRFPLWLAPEQLRIIQVKTTDEVQAFVQKLMAAAREKGIRVTVDDDNQSVGKKIRESEVWKVPYALVIGDKEVQTGRLKPRVRADIAVLGDVEREYEVEQFLESLAHEIKARASKSSL